jgi:hypothetical protein
MVETVFAARSARMMRADAGGTTSPESSTPSSAASAAKPQLVENPVSAPQRIPQEVLMEAMAASSGQGPGSQHSGNKQSASKKDWNSLLSSRRAAPARANTPASPAAADSKLLQAVLEATASDQAQPGEALPSGFQDGITLAQLIAKKQNVNGLVVSIGLTGALSGGVLPERVHNLMQSLMGEGDFATQSKPDEFLMIFPNERGAAAQRRLSQVAQRLWDFQLTSLGSHAIQFSWGGLEVRGESIGEAIAAASERMMETKRGRKNLGLEAVAQYEEPLRQAV